MESSIAKFLWRQPACERLPTKRHSSNRSGGWALRRIDGVMFGHLGAGLAKRTELWVLVLNSGREALAVNLPG